MRFSALRYHLLFLSILLPYFSYSQYEDGPRTIKIKKESVLAKAKYDEVEFRLFVEDRFGNVRDNKIASYLLYVKTKKGVEAFKGESNELTPEMLAFLRKQKEAVKIFFTEITAIEGVDHEVRLPDVIEVWFPECPNREKEKRRGRR